MFVDVDRHGPYRLPAEVVERHRGRPVAWGFGALSWVTFQRSYSRDGEDWWQTCRRVVEGMLTVQRCHCLEHGRPWDAARADAVASQAFERMVSFKWTPPGRGLWVMGTRYLYERGGAALNNCGFVSTADLAADLADPFTWMFAMSLLGVGVGFDTRGRGSVVVSPARRGDDVHLVEDSREGWVTALRRLLHAHAGVGSLPARWDLSAIRPAGSPLASFGGEAGGPEPLRAMLEDLETLYARHAGRTVDSALIVDTMNLIGRCVVAGGIRRAAQIAFGDPDDGQFLDLKQDPEKLRSHRWAANHSIYATRGMDYREVARRTARNGEPGYLWLDNARARGRMADPPDDADAPAMGTNPCAEQTLWDRELCCLVETYPAHHRDLRDYLATLDVAFEYAKTVTLVATCDERSNAVMLRNRRIGCSLSGVVQAIERHGERAFFDWCDRGYAHLRRLDRELSGAFGVPESIKVTSVKPSGTVSLLAGATPGVHHDHAPTYLRRVRVTAGHPLVALCREAGYPVEPDAVAPNTEVVSFPIRVRWAGRRKADVPLREKLELAARLQHHWSDNQVSCTADFDPANEAGEIPALLAEYEDRLKGIGFLPREAHGYAQPPYQEIPVEEYERLCAGLRPLRGELAHEPDLEARHCEGPDCDLVDPVDRAE